MISGPIVLFLGGNAFGIRRRQGRTYVSAFETTQPYGTAQLAGLKVFVRTACVLVALIAVGVSVWASSSLVGAWGAWLVDGKKDALPGLLQSRQKFGDAFGGLTGYAFAALAVITSMVVAVMVASLAAFSALRARYPRRVLIAGSLLLLMFSRSSCWRWRRKAGSHRSSWWTTIFRVTGWSLVAAMVLATIYLSGAASRSAC